MNTCLVESTHARRAKWARKDIEYPLQFRGRAALAAVAAHLPPFYEHYLIEQYVGSRISQSTAVKARAIEWERREEAKRHASGEGRRHRAMLKQLKRKRTALGTKKSQKRMERYDG